MGRLIKPVQGQFDASGQCTVTIGVPSGVVWKIETTTVSTTSATRTTASVYLGSPSPSALVDSTYSGNRDTSNTVHQAIGGEILTCVWTGGTPGAVATFRVAGQQNQV